MKKIFIFFSMILMLVNIKSVSASTLNCHNYFQYGTTGEEVKILQTKLNETMNCKLAVDGIVGIETTKCIIKYQIKNNLDVDGIVGPKTCAKINSATKNTNTITSSNTSNTNYVVVIGDVVNVRKKSNENSAIKGTVKQGQVLKIYGTKTTNDKTWYKIYTKETGYGFISGAYARKTAIVLDISDQQLTYYSAGKILMNVPVITGKKDIHDTPIGKYTLNPNNKTQNETLRGKNDDGTNYEAFVNYWMPFITERGIGFHDASWRSEDTFTNTTYIENGSHGCVNMRSNDAKQLYENIYNTTYVIVRN